MTEEFVFDMVDDEVDDDEADDEQDWFTLSAEAVVLADVVPLVRPCGNVVVVLLVG